MAETFQLYILQKRMPISNTNKALRDNGVWQDCAGYTSIKTARYFRDNGWFLNEDDPDGVRWRIILRTDTVVEVGNGD